jgi:hypothetical protein
MTSLVFETPGRCRRGPNRPGFTRGQWRKVKMWLRAASGFSTSRPAGDPSGWSMSEGAYQSGPPRRCRSSSWRNPISFAAGGFIDHSGVDEQLDDVPRSDGGSGRQRRIGNQRLAVVGREVDATRVGDGDGDGLPGVEPARAETQAMSPLRSSAWREVRRAAIRTSSELGISWGSGA